jgi:hypothetical protein
MFYFHPISSAVGLTISVSANKGKPLSVGLQVPNIKSFLFFE